MACFLVPTTPMVKLAFVPSIPRLVIGYPPYATHATGPVTAAAPVPRYAPPTLAVPRAPTTNGTFRLTALTQPTATPVTTRVPTQTLQRPVRTTFHSSAVVQRPTQPRLFRAAFKPGVTKGVKRKLDENEVTDKVDSTVREFTHPLFCKVCRVTLNAPAQAKQHYDGKNHAKKMKMFAEAKPSENGSTDGKEQPSSTTNGKTTTQEIHPEIYCKVCGVSFNSSKQAYQHYQGKNHAKRLRATNSNTPISPTNDTNSPTKCGVKLTCHVRGTEPLESRLKGARVNCVRPDSPTLPGRWPSNRTTGNTKQTSLNADAVTASNDSSSSYTFLPSTLKRAIRDFSMYRTPSGKFYCSGCNMTLNTDVQFAQHVDSKRHKASITGRKNPDSTELSS